MRAGSENWHLRHFRAERVNGEIVITEDPNGKYRAHNAEQVQRALCDNKRETGQVEVLIGNKWVPIKRN